MSLKMFDMTPGSKFDTQLYQKHVLEAADFTRLCQQQGHPLLDPCGPRGDLYFLLKAQLAVPKPALKPASKTTAPGERKLRWPTANSQNTKE